MSVNLLMINECMLVIGHKLGLSLFFVCDCGIEASQSYCVML